MNSLEKYFEFLNREKPSESGVLDIFKYILHIRYIFFHWPENIPERKHGILQFFFLHILLLIIRLRGIRIIYVVHNKISHSKHRMLLKRNITKYLIKMSFMVITHASEGVSFIRDITCSDKDVFYFPHPVKSAQVYRNLRKNTDVLIWGVIAPYKGIDRFIRNIAKSDEGSKWKIVIAGKVPDMDYLEILLKDIPANVKIMNAYITDEELNRLISGSRIVLFPYHKNSILSSGAFARTVVFPVSIIGPDCGSFSDFSYLPQVFVFANEEEIIPLIERTLNNHVNITPDQTKEILEQYSWESFSDSFMAELLSKN